MLKEFKAFALRGNVLDLAIGVVIGTAFGTIVSSLVDDLIMPLIGLLIGGFDISKLSIPLQDGNSWNYGAFIMAVVNFLIIALALFLAMKLIRRFTERMTPAEADVAEEPRHCPFCLETVADEATRCSHCTSMLPEL